MGTARSQIQNAQALAGAPFAGWIGAAREDITPPIGIAHRNWGAARHDVADGIHRPLTATALTLQDSPDAPPLVLIAADLGWWKSAADEQFVRQHVLDALEMDPARLMIALSHTHSGPSLCRDEMDGPGGHLVASYLDSLRDAFVRAARQALQHCRESILEWRYGRCTLAANRDLPDPAADRYLTGWNPTNPADDTLLVGRVTAIDSPDRPNAIVVNYACHPTTLAWQNTLISPDFVGQLRETVEGTTGALCMYLHGASGELSPREQYTDDVTVADRHGKELGYAALSTLASMNAPTTKLAFTAVVESGAPLAVWKPVPVEADRTLVARSVPVSLELKVDFPSLKDLDAAIAVCPAGPSQERLLRKRWIRLGIGGGDCVEVPFWIWRVGGAILMGHPNEAYSMLQTKLRAQLPMNPFMAMNVVNGHCGYLPPAALYREELYSVWQTPFECGSLEKLITTVQQASLDLLGRDQGI